jgi:sec-independent protein translocase protein TatC
MPRPSDVDLFAEEQSMPAMSFGDHIEELRVRLILALFGLAAGILLAVIPVPTPWGTYTIGQWVFDRMQKPAQDALDTFYNDATVRREKEAEQQHLITKPFEVQVELGPLADKLREWIPDAKIPSAEELAGQSITLPMVYKQADWIEGVHNYAERKRALISLAPLETFMIYFMVCIVTGLVIASPWVFYQIWNFIAAGLYRHERFYVMKFLPFSLGLFLGGVMLCFFIVLPFTLKFLLEFNVWLNIEPSLRINEWMSFATMLPLIFGICFQTPLVMLLLERVGVFTADDYKSKRKYAILIIVVAAAAITPTGDPFTMGLLAVPMYGLYELGIRRVPNRKEDVPAPLAS